MALLWTTFNAGTPRNGAYVRPPSGVSSSSSNQSAYVRNQWALAMGGGAASSRWARVTNAAPTPAFLRPFAALDDLTPAGPDDSSVHQAYSATYYLKDDPGLSASSPYGVLFRINTRASSSSSSTEPHTRLEVCDTKFSNTFFTTTEQSTNPGSTNTIDQDDTSKANWNGERQIHIWENTNSLLIATFADGGEQRGFGMLLYPDPPADGHITREALAPLFGFTGSNLEYGGTPGTGLPGVREGFAAYWNISYSGGGLKSAPDVLGRNFMQRVFLSRDDAPPFAYPTDPDLFFTQGNAVTQQAVVDVGGRDYACAVSSSNLSILTAIE